jgi:hypothetical protein
VRGQLFQVLHLAQADGRHDVAHVVLAAEDIDVDAVHAAAGHALQAVFLGQARFFRLFSTRQPPSPVVMFLLAWKLNETKSPKEPIGLPFQL